MGIRGLTSFLEHKNTNVKIDILRRIRFWKRDDRTSPIIVIDLTALAYSHFDAKDFMCGGRYNVIFDNFENLLKQMTDIGAHLVFFSCLNNHIYTGKKNEPNKWLDRFEKGFQTNIEIYDAIRAGKTLSEIDAMIQNQYIEFPRSALFGMDTIAKKYGKCHYISAKNKLEIKMASFATRNNARAIVSDNSDFYIYNGDWKFWSAKQFQIDERNPNKFKTIQFDRNALVRFCGIDAIHRPLLATLLGNDCAEGFRNELAEFEKRLEKYGSRVEKVAKYVKKLQRNDQIHELNFECLSEDLFGSREKRYIQFLKRSIDSYDLDRHSHDEMAHDILNRLLSSTQYYRDVSMLMDDDRILILSFYDLRGEYETETLPVLFLNWDRRKSGILRKVLEIESNPISVFAKFRFDGSFRVRNKKPLRPKIDVPDIEDLYLDHKPQKINWDMLAFVMRFDDVLIAVIKSLPSAFRLVCTTLLVLVKGGHCTEDEADGILLTMYMVQTDESTVRKAQYPTNLNEDNIRAAHIFNNTIDQVRQNFAIAGLLLEIQALSRFDGVYFQQVMDLTRAERRKLMFMCQSYRIYNDIGLTFFNLKDI